jgi:hypothetical protein
MKINYDSVLKANTAAIGIANRLKASSGGLPDTIPGIQDAAFALSKTFEQGQELGPGFFLLDEGARFRFLVRAGFDRSRVNGLPISAVLEEAKAVSHPQVRNQFEQAYYLMMAMLNYNDPVPANRKARLERIQANNWDFVIRAFEGSKEEALHLFGTVKRHIEHEKFRSELKPCVLAPDMTLDVKGKEFVNIMARGIIRFCWNNKIPVSRSIGEFEGSVVKIGRESRLDGGVAFQDTKTFEELLIWLDVSDAKDIAQYKNELLSATDLPPELDQVVNFIKVIDTSPLQLSMQERAYWIRQWGGDKAESLAKAFENHDCQRRLVFNAMCEIQESRKTTQKIRKSDPITESEIGRQFVRLLAEGLIGYCNEFKVPYPETLKEYEDVLMVRSRIGNAQAGMAFMHKSSHRKFYQLLGIDPDLAGRPHSELIELAKQDKALAKGLKLVFAFSTPADPSTRQIALKRNADILRTEGGSDFNLIADAFKAGDCQADLVFLEMQNILNEGLKTE